VYQVESSRILFGGRRRGVRTGARAGSRTVSRTVVLLGLTSLFTDISAEMVTTILPVYVVLAMGSTPLQYGVIDGIYQGASALARLAGGVAADRRRRHKQVAALGYAISAACKIGMALAGQTLAGLGALVFADRTGKGIRTAPRDALISLSSRPEGLGLAFGVHRALDTAGAMLGPLVAFALLTLAPRRFDAVFVVSFLFALVGLAILVLFVRNRPEPAPREGMGAAERGDAAGAAERDAAGLGAAGAAPAASLRAALALLAVPRVRGLVAAAGGLGLVTLSDGFIYLGLQTRLDFAPRLLPLLFVGSALVFMLLAVPVGRLADRVGRGKVFVAGYGALALVYGALLAPSLPPAAVLGCLVALGAYYAATDGVLSALASAILPEELRASGLGLVTTANALARLAAALLFGALWTWAGVQAAIAAFAIGLAVAMAGTALLLVRHGTAGAPA
jgi:MFS family permease